MTNREDSQDIWKKPLEILMSTPPMAVALFFLYLCGTVIVFLLLETAPFVKHQAATTSLWFKLAIGFLPGAIVMLMYAGVVHGRVISTVEDLTMSALPSSLILAGILCFVLLWRCSRWR